jgi:hypothetical protein
MWKVFPWTSPKGPFGTECGNKNKITAMPPFATECGNKNKITARPPFGQKIVPIFLFFCLGRVILIITRFLKEVRPDFGLF